MLCWKKINEKVFLPEVVRFMFQMELCHEEKYDNILIPVFSNTSNQLTLAKVLVNLSESFDVKLQLLVRTKRFQFKTLKLFRNGIRRMKKSSETVLAGNTSSLFAHQLKNSEK